MHPLLAFFLLSATPLIAATSQVTLTNGGDIPTIPNFRYCPGYDPEDGDNFHVIKPISMNLTAHTDPAYPYMTLRFRGFAYDNFDNTSIMHIRVNASTGVLWKKYDKTVKYCERLQGCGDIHAGDSIIVAWEKIIYKYWERVFELQLAIYSEDPEVGTASCIIGKVDLDELEKRPKRASGDQGLGELK
ncbi:hypothetical protein B0T16DRAFT_415450 [Cercophora newfieldiana]|uniref:Uncharacterized protein n=1 Tax=Cercophora newfieldiana TaxID=92897 RepID=A0AA39XZJ1_9PEZI|nr:hypothetical protein B0T16DRAFT_415450 [Cercophora newfieldiana]